MVFPLPVTHIGLLFIPVLFLSLTRHKTVFMLYLIWGAYVFGYDSLLGVPIYWLFFEIVFMAVDWFDGGLNVS